MRYALAAALIAAVPVAEAACPSDDAIAAFVAGYRALEPARSFGPGLTIDDGLCAQARIVAALSTELGRQVGYKAGLTNKATQERFKVPHPVRGVLLERMLLPSGSTVTVPYGAIPVFEADLVVRVSDERINAAESDLDVLRSLSAAAPFIELPDLVFARGELVDGGNLTAINVGARLGVVGADVPVQATEAFAAALARMTVRMTDDTGRELAVAPGSAILGHPLNVVRWLAGDLRRRGERLKVGDVLSLGSYSPLLPAASAVGRTITVRYEGMPGGDVAVTVRLAAREG
ncbi:MAG: hydratase [Alphaproteobacteria bacterium]|nr:hydratase [Alphaproteobacteria bacterium]